MLLVTIISYYPTISVDVIVEYLMLFIFDIYLIFLLKTVIVF